jgi:sigma-B regulation protein RsbU (phosphoserine phosphatase)
MTDKIDILIAEDSRLQARMLKKKLEQAGYAVRWAENGKTALEMTRQQRPTLIISDIEMPEMSGYEFCEAVKSDPELKTIPLVLLSTLSEPEDIIRGLHVGADNYVTKPYEASYLLSRMDDLLSTPLGHDDEPGQVLDVKLAGKSYQVKAGTQQVLNLLVSTFENAVEKNNELIQSNEELSLARDQLTQWNKELETLNEKLETANTRMSRDLDAAARIQQSLLPTSAPDLAQATFAWKYLPCDELAGDFLNLFALDDRHLAMFVVDVSGHGVASSLLSVTIGRVLTPQVSSSSLLVQRVEGSSEIRIVPPAEVAFELNNRFPMEEQGGLYFTMVYGVLDLEAMELRYVSAGHPPVLHQPRDGDPRLITAEDMAIGWVDDMEFEEHVLKLSAGDRVYLYSDGVPEAMDHDLNEFGDQRMIDDISATKSDPVDRGVASLLEAVEQWCVKNGPKDDVSILAMQVAD